MSTLKFTKMQGLGNDFVVIDCLDGEVSDFRPVIKNLSDRRFGIGFDQMLVLHPSKEADFRMEVINSDGSEVEMCGNGIRCVAQYLVKHGITSNSELSIETLAGIIPLRLLDGAVEVDMGEPELNGTKIPTTLEGMVINYPLKIEEESYKITCVSMGNPHCVIFLDRVDEFPVSKIGPIIENHPLFPNRINAEFVQIIDPSHLKMRVWERGTGETMACGTGACATLVAAVLNGHSQREALVHLEGGNLNIRWSEKDNHVYMTGPGEEVFSGTIEIP